MSERTQSTVGELLNAAECAALRLVGDTEPNDALPLTAGWAAVVDAGYEVLAAIPQPTVGEVPLAGPDGRLTTRLQRMAMQAHRLPPLDIAPHPTAARVAATLRQAAGLLHRHAHPGLARDPEARADAAASRVKVARTVAAMAHVTGGELQAYTRQVMDADRAASGAPKPARALSSIAVARWVRMVQGHEQQALDFVAGRLRDLDGERPGPGVPGAAFGLALTSWTIRALQRTADPGVSGADLQHIAHAENALLKTAVVLTAAAVARDELDTDTGRYLQHRLQAAAAGWATVGGLWGWVRTPDAQRASPDTTSAAAALHVAIAVATRSGATWTNPLDVVQRFDGVRLLRLVQTIVEDSAELADAYQQLPLELQVAGRLRVAAGILRQMAIEHTDQTLWKRPAAKVDDHSSPPPVRLIDVASKRLQSLTSD